MNIADNIKYLRTSHDLSQLEFGKIANASDKAVSSWENGTRIPRMGVIERIAVHFGIQKSDIIEGDIKEKLLPHGTFPVQRKPIPLIGTIAAGTPITAEQNINGYFLLDDNVKADFALLVKGDSMIGDGINDGDIVFIRKQPDVENGEMAAVYIDGSATLKRVYKTDKSVELWPANAKYRPFIYSADNCDDIRILGKAIAVTKPIV